MSLDPWICFAIGCASGAVVGVFVSRYGQARAWGFGRYMLVAWPLSVALMLVLITIGEALS